MIEITIANANDDNNVQGQFQILQQIILAVVTESHTGGTESPPSSIMGGRNEQAKLRSINQYGDWYIRKVKFQISSQSSRKCMISEPHPETLATNNMESNADTHCIGINSIVLAMTETTSNVYTCNTSYA